MTRHAGMARRWLRRAAALAMLLAVCGGGAAVASAQETGAVPAPTTLAFAQDEAAISVLPPPATQRAYRHVFIAFGVTWALILGYGVLLSRRVNAAERDVERLVERRR